MCQTNSLVPKKLKGRIAIIILSALALISMILSCAENFLFHNYIHDVNIYSYELTLRSQSIFDVLFVILLLSPYILTFLYSLVFYKKQKSFFMMSMVFCLLAVFYFIVYFNTVGAIGSQLISFALFTRIIITLIRVLFLLLGAFSILGLFRRFSKIILLFVIFANFILDSIAFVCYYEPIIFYTENYLSVYTLSSFCNIIGSIFFHVALLIFAIRNKITTKDNP